jgi:hypothetical protein
MDRPQSPVSVLKLCERCGRPTDTQDDDPYGEMNALCFTCEKLYMIRVNEYHNQRA